MAPASASHRDGSPTRVPAIRDVLPPNCSDSSGAVRERLAMSGGDSGGRPAANCGVENVGHSGGPRGSNVVGSPRLLRSPSESAPER
jgi:hypothetical protein